MKKIFNIGAICLSLAAATLMTSCSDQFIEDKKNYSNASSEVYDYYSGANGRLNECYRITLPNIQAGGAQIWQYNSLGMSDNHSQSTEEYRGFSTFVNPQVEMNTVTGTSGAPGYFGSSWARIREINETIAGIQNGSLTEDEKDQLLGQAIFLRAWCYYLLFRYYGSVPLVTEVQKPVPESFTPRSTAKEVYEFICSELDQAAEMLRKKTVESSWSNNDWGRVTTGTCLAFKHRMMILWASPLFNRANDKSRWTAAYETIKKELPTINACGYGLANENDPGKNGSGWAKMFLQIVGNPEAVFVSCYNKRTPDLTPDYQRNNLWEQQIRPANTLGNNGKTPADMIVDLFPMKDGKRPSTYDSYTKLEASSIAYDAEHPFMNRDPRFYRTFAFPGVRWAYKVGGHGDATAMDPHNPSYDGGANYVLWNYNWFYNGDILDIDNNSYRGADNISKAGGVMVRKKSDDLDVNAAVYDYRPDGQGAKNGGYAVPFCSAAPLMELRYAEVLLNLAEVACLAGHTDESYAILKRIRQRAGYTGDCGLTVSSDEATCMSAILYERQIEFAYEGKRFDDMRRWMLFDGGAELPQGAPSTWLPSGWGGNTCTWLGFKPFNGQRRESFMYQVNWENVDEYSITTARQDYDKDPLLEYLNDNDWTRPDGVDLRKDLTQQLIDLKDFYKKYLVYTERPGDDRNTDKSLKYINYLPKYYFLGFSQGVSAHNQGLLQTIGWEDYNNGGALGTFDPLAE